MSFPCKRSLAIGLALACLVATGLAYSGDPSPAANKHWAFQPVSRPTVPSVRQADWVRNGIDAFVLSRFESSGIRPSPEADRYTLIRRLSLDLLGLLPTPAEVDAFVNDARSDAYETLVDRLLASPHFGERWGRHWLDQARYADSDGYEKDSPRPYAYLYRNWVIDAINRDLPFDRFTVEQIAGDLLPGATLDQQIATGFHRNTLTNREGGVDQEEYRNRANVDRVNTTSTVWLGLTMGCCECHNHKYDPFTQSDFYRMFAFFNTSIESDVPAAQPAERTAYEAAKKVYDAEHARLQAAVAAFEKDQLPSRLAAWEATVRDKLPKAGWVVLDPLSARSAGGATLTQQPDGSIQVTGKSPPEDTYTLEFDTPLAGITAFRLEVLPDAGHPAKGPGRVKHGNFVLNELRVSAAPQTLPEAPARDAAPVGLENATADFSQAQYGVRGAIDGDPKTGWAVAPEFGKPHIAVFETKDPARFPGATRIVVTLDQQYGQQHTIGRFRISATTAARPVAANTLPEAVLEALRVDPAARTDQQRGAIATFHRERDPDLKKLTDAVAEHAKKAPAAPATRAMTIAANASPPKTHIHVRGDFLRKGDEVNAGTPATLHPLRSRGQGPDRLDFARWLVAPSNPLTARVTMNRVWQTLFGRGLVTTPEDFGTRGERPSHPELLDWLAGEFMSRDWSRKAMIKRIVMSNTYRQSSRIRPELVDRDPNNVLVARQNRYRVEAEVLRDLSLAASGLLTPTVGGPSVRPPQPAGVSDLTYAGSAKWIESTGPDRYRRGMYTWFQRTSPYPMLMTFDSPDGVNCTVRRERSNTPLQALTLLNDAVFLECAQGLARRIARECVPTDPAARVRYGFRLCMSREPSAVELARLTQAYGEFVAICRANPDAAEKLAGTQKLDGVERADAAAWVALARTVLNLDEFVTRE